MANAARKLELEHVTQETATVITVERGRLVLRTRQGELSAKRAVSCLVEPRPDDVVLVSFTERGAYVLAVLEREEAGATIALEGDLAIRLGSGRFTVAAQKGLDLVSAEGLGVVAGRVDVRAVDGSVVVERLSMLSSFLQAEVAKVKVFAGTVDGVFDRISQRVKRSYRNVEELDQVRAERVDYKAKKEMCLRGHDTLVTAEQLVKLDGEQIHVG